MLFKIKSKNHQGKTLTLLNAPKTLKNIDLHKTEIRLIFSYFFNFEEPMQCFYKLKVNPFEVMSVVF